MQEIDGNIQSGFSSQYLDLQKGFCCDTGNVKLIRWVGCKPSVFKGSKTLFSSDDLGFCSWFQEIEKYGFITLDVDPNGFAEFELKDAKYFLIKNLWEEGAIDSQKVLEVGLNQQEAVIGATVPFNIGYPHPPVYDYHFIKDVYLANTTRPWDGFIHLNNCSPYKVSVTLFYAS